MTRFRRSAWMLTFALAGVLAACGCARRAVAPVGDSLSAAEPSAHTAKDGDDKSEAGPAYQFPADAGGALLAKVLPPTDPKGAPDELGGFRRTSPAALAAPPLSLPPPGSQVAPPPVPGERTRKPPAPRLVSEEPVGLGGEPETPSPRTFPVAGKTRVPSPDVNEPIPLPILAQPTPDRAPLDDPTADASAEAATAAAMPQRTNAAPYVRITLPEPFDNRQTFNLPLPAEGDNPQTGTVHPPKP